MFGRTIHLFTLFGFRVGIDFTWFVLAILVAWSLASYLFPAYYKGYTTDIYWAMGMVGAVGLFLSIVFHEFWHSMVARRLGLPMKGITLFIFGGVAEMEEEPANARTEFLMAIVGPLSSAVLGGIFLGLYWGVRSADGPASVWGVLQYLGWLNLLLAVFNMIPAFPLDGGRVFRSIRLTDLAVIRIEATDLISVPLGDSRKVVVGDWVLAIGAPEGLPETVTAGIISAKGRSISGDYESFFQTDAAINPGNSGGPLTNMKGQVIGINTAIISPERMNSGIGLAIPSATAQYIMTQLIEKGQVVRGYVGVEVQDVRAKLAQSFDLPTTQGALVTTVMPDGPAAKAGLKPEDFITAVDGKPVDNSSALRRMVWHQYHDLDTGSGTEIRLSDLPPGSPDHRGAARLGGRVRGSDSGHGDPADPGPAGDVRPTGRPDPLRRPAPFRGTFARDRSERHKGLCLRPSQLRPWAIMPAYGNRRI